MCAYMSVCLSVCVCCCLSGILNECVSAGLSIDDYLSLVVISLSRFPRANLSLLLMVLLLNHCFLYLSFPFVLLFLSLSF